MSIHLTEKTIRSLEHPSKGQKYYFDTKIPGFGLCVGNKTKTFFIQRTVKHKTHRVKIGRYNELNCTQARDLALQNAVLLQQGKHPCQNDDSDTQEPIITLQQLYDQYQCSLTNRGKLSSLNEYPSILNRHFSDWLPLPIDQITTKMVMERHHHITTNTGPCSANKSFRILRTLYNHISAEDETLLNPVRILTSRKLWNAEQHRNVRILDHQFTPWLKHCLMLPNDITRLFLLFVLLNGLRRNEAQSLRWDDIDLTHGSFTVRKTKNKRPHTLPITSNTRIILDALLRLKINDYVFPSNKSRSGHIKEPKTSTKRINQSIGTQITVHDLRRTFASVANNLRLTPYTIKQLINHSMRDVTAIYVTDDVDSLREPLETIQNKILQLSTMDTDQLRQSFKPL